MEGLRGQMSGLQVHSLPHPELNPNLTFNPNPTPTLNNAGALTFITTLDGADRAVTAAPERDEGGPSHPNMRHTTHL